MAEGTRGWVIARREVSPLLEDLVAARMQMAMSLGWHIVVACLGVGFPC